MHKLLTSIMKKHSLYTLIYIYMKTASTGSRCEDPNKKAFVDRNRDFIAFNNFTIQETIPTTETHRYLLHN